MKIVAVLILSLLAASCDAQQADVRAPVNVAFELYKGCLQGTLQNQHYPEKTDEVEDFVADLDSMCMDWTVTWLAPLTNRKFSDDEAKRFDVRREAILTSLIKELDSFTRKK